MKKVLNKSLILPLAMIATIFVAQAVFAAILWVPDGVRIGYPERGQEVPERVRVTGSAWMAPDRDALASIEVVATSDSGGTVRAKGARLVVMDRGEPLFPLHWWCADLELPSRGDWELKAVATAIDGRSLESASRTVVAGDGWDKTFVPWSATHLVTVVACLAGIALFAVACGKGGEAFVRKVAPWYAIAALGNELAWHFYWFFSDSWSVHDNLYTHMCGIAVLLVPVAMAMEPGKARDRLSELLYFWGVGGAIQALVFPDVGAHGFPSFRYFAFFFSHSAIIAGSLSLATSRIAKITIGSLLRMFAITNAVLVPMWFFDRLVALVPPYSPANYFLLGYSWPAGSIVEVFAGIFGPSPWYVIGFEIMGVFVFGALWLPWAVARKLAARKALTA